MKSHDSATRLLLLLSLATASAACGGEEEQTPTSADDGDAVASEDTGDVVDGSADADDTSAKTDTAGSDTTVSTDTLSTDTLAADTAQGTDATSADAVTDTLATDTYVAPVDAGPCLATCTDTTRTTTAMAQIRSGHASATLPDGKVMVFDGIESSDTGPRYEVFDPATEAWSVPTMTGAPTYPGDVAYLRAGGDVVTGQTSYSTRLSFYTPSPSGVGGAWKSGAYPSLATTDPFSAILPSGHAVVGGGWVTGGYTRAGLYGYDPTTDTWKLGALNEPRRSALATAAGTRALVVGGRNGLSDLFSAELVEPLTAVSRFTGSPRRWFFETKFVSLANGDVLKIGGKDSTRGAMEDVERWSIATGKWSLVDPLVTPRLDAALVLLKDGRVLAIGGRNATNVPIATIEVFDPTTNRWQLIGSLTTARYGAAASVMNDGRVLVTGGTKNSSIRLTSVEIVDPTKPCAVAGAVVCACTAESDLALCERYDATCGTPALVDRCGKTRNVACTGDTCGTAEECSITAGSSRCVWKTPTGSRFRVEPFGFSNYFQTPTAIGGDALDRPTMIVEGTAVGTNFDDAVALNARLPSGRWVREGLTSAGSSAVRVTSAFAPSVGSGRAPRILVTRSGSDGLSLYRWDVNAWTVQALSGLYATRMSGRALVSDASDKASIAWVRQPFAGTAYDVGFTVAEPTVATTAVDTITSGSDIGAALDAAGTPHLAYVDSVTGVKYATRPATTWTKEVVDAAGGSRAHVFVDGAGAVHLVWQGKTSADVVKHAVRGVSGWVVDTWTLPQSDAYTPRYAVGADGKVHVAWSSKTANAILYAVRSGSSWAVETVYTPGGPTDSLYTSALSVTKDGRPRIAFNLGGSIFYATVP